MPSADLQTRVLGSVQAVPTTFFVDEHGAQIGEAILGAQTEDAWRQVFDELLADYGDAQ